MTRLLALLLFVSPALAGECLVNCSVAYKRPMSGRELCFAQQAALRQEVEAQRLEIARLREELEAARHQVVEPNKVMPPCKMKGRTRNAAGQCGKWK